MDAKLESVIRQIDKLYDKTAEGHLSKPESSADGKCVWLGTDNFRLEVDTDDCDQKIAKDSIRCLRLIWNNWPEIRKQFTSNP